LPCRIVAGMPRSDACKYAMRKQSGVLAAVKTRA
jgi:hypothetical protein